MKIIAYAIFLCISLHFSYSEDDIPREGKVISEEILREMPYITPKAVGDAHLVETFDDIEQYKKRWVASKAKKDDTSEDIAKYNGQWDVETPEAVGAKDFGLVLKSKAKHHAISAKLDKPYIFEGKPFVIQYEVQFQNGQECGGAYLKLLTHDKDFDLNNFHDKVPYTIMFGPDKCGSDAKLHFIFRHKNPKNGSIEEKHWKKSKDIPKFDDVFNDKKPHLFTLILTPDDQFEVRLDHQVIQQGSLLEEFEPPINPPAEIDDPTDFKPSDWDDKPKIADPDDFKPDDWNEEAPEEIIDLKAEKPSGWLDDEEKTIPNPDAVKPEDWDDDMDGEWEAPRISNPKCESAPGCGEWKQPVIRNPEYKGKWKPASIDNPNYKGVWKPKKMPNPDFFEDKKPYHMMPIGAIGFELWSMSEGILFDNIIITDDIQVATQFAHDGFDSKKERADSLSDSAVTRLIRYTNKNPWLWAVYLLLLAIPVVLFITFCCKTSSQEKQAVGQKKKQDVPTADDPIPEESPNEVVDEEAEDNNEEAEVENDGEEVEEEEDAKEEEEAEEVQQPRTSPRRRKPRVE